MATARPTRSASVRAAVGVQRDTQPAAESNAAAAGVPADGGGAGRRTSPRTRAASAPQDAPPAERRRSGRIRWADGQPDSVSLTQAAEGEEEQAAGTPAASVPPVPPGADAQRAFAAPPPVADAVSERGDLSNTAGGRTAPAAQAQPTAGIQPPGQVPHRNQDSPSSNIRPPLDADSGLSQAAQPGISHSPNRTANAPSVSAPPGSASIVSNSLVPPGSGRNPTPSEESDGLGEGIDIDAIMREMAAEEERLAAAAPVFGERPLLNRTGNAGLPSANSPARVFAPIGQPGASVPAVDTVQPRSVFGGTPSGGLLFTRAAPTGAPNTTPSGTLSGSTDGHPGGGTSVRLDSQIQHDPGAVHLATPRQDAGPLVPPEGRRHSPQAPTIASMLAGQPATPAHIPPIPLRRPSPAGPGGGLDHSGAQVNAPPTRDSRPGTEGRAGSTATNTRGHSRPPAPSPTHGAAVRTLLSGDAGRLSGPLSPPPAREGASYAGPPVLRPDGRVLLRASDCERVLRNTWRRLTFAWPLPGPDARVEDSPVLVAYDPHDASYYDPGEIEAEGTFPGVFIGGSSGAATGRSSTQSAASAGRTPNSATGGLSAPGRLSDGPDRRTAIGESQADGGNGPSGAERTLGGWRVVTAPPPGSARAGSFRGDTARMLPDAQELFFDGVVAGRWVGGARTTLAQPPTRPPPEVRALLPRGPPAETLSRLLQSAPLLYNRAAYVYNMAAATGSDKPRRPLRYAVSAMHSAALVARSAGTSVPLPRALRLVRPLGPPLNFAHVRDGPPYALAVPVSLPGRIDPSAMRVVLAEAVVVASADGSGETTILPRVAPGEVEVRFAPRRSAYDVLRPEELMCSSYERHVAGVKRKAGLRDLSGEVPFYDVGADYADSTADSAAGSGGISAEQRRMVEPLRVPSFGGAPAWLVIEGPVPFARTPRLWQLMLVHVGPIRSRAPVPETRHVAAPAVVRTAPAVVRTAPAVVDNTPADLPLEHVVARMRFVFGGGADDVCTERVCVSLACPVLLTRMRVPVRLEACVHMQCVDEAAMAVGAAPGQGPGFVCLICGGRAQRYARDGLFAAILAGAPPGVASASIDVASGRWTYGAQTDAADVLSSSDDERARPAPKRVDALPAPPDLRTGATPHGSSALDAIVID